MRLLATNGDKRAVTQDGLLLVQERHAGEWWDVFHIPLENLAEAHEEYQGFLEELQEPEGDTA